MKYYQLAIIVMGVVMFLPMVAYEHYINKGKGQGNEE